jgi:hypothetical protein
MLLTLDFFKRQRSHALHTRLRTLSGCESDEGLLCLAVMAKSYFYEMRRRRGVNGKRARVWIK